MSRSVVFPQPLSPIRAILSPFSTVSERSRKISFSSNAFEISKKLGLADAIIDEARLRISSNVNKEMTIELMLLNIKEN